MHSATMPASMYQFMSSTAEGWLCSGSNHKSPSPEERSRRHKQTREKAARSKSGTWGPTHSFDTEEEEKKTDRTPATKSLTRCDGSGSTKSLPSPAEYVGRVWSGASSVLKCGENDTASAIHLPNRSLMDLVDDVCSPCHPRNLAKTMSTEDQEASEPALGISPMKPPTSNESPKTPSISRNSNAGDQHSITSHETPADRRRERHRRRQQRAELSAQVAPIEEPPEEKEEAKVEPPEDKELPKPQLPLDTLTLRKEDAYELERSISELTMRSSYGQATAKIAENRRMAYYAVGRHHRQSGRGGNRRCYFTGKLILSGAPFYAGSVQQGLRTLVVFCLPSSIGLPVDSPSSPQSVVQSLNESTQTSTRRFSLNLGGSIGKGALTRKGSRISRLSSVDDMSLSVGEELDPNYGLDREYLLNVLPEPSQSLLDEMAVRYPAQFETLPVQVRSPSCWRLFVKFCFFSGLPIAEGELHYKVRDEISDHYGEEVILSHEVMEAVNGESAEFIRLPNLKTFKYLHKHYNQQSSKLPKHFFERTSWELVRPEV